MKAIEIGMALRKTFTCPTCGKSRLLVNNAGYRQAPRVEAFDPKRHCTCPLPKIVASRDAK